MREFLFSRSFIQSAALIYRQAVVQCWRKRLLSSDSLFYSWLLPGYNRTVRRLLYVTAEKLMLGLPPTITVIKDMDDAAAVAAARAGISAPLITRTAATPQDSPKDSDLEQMNNSERSSSLQLPYSCAVIITLCICYFIR